MKISWFHLMPYRFLPKDFEDKYRSVWVDVPSHLFEADKAHQLYNEYLDELEFADEVGFDGICVNEHHNNAYGIMPSPNITAATLTRRTKDAAIIVLGQQPGAVQSATARLPKSSPCWTASAVVGSSRAFQSALRWILTSHTALIRRHCAKNTMKRMTS